jgi:hypothetical protein
MVSRKNKGTERPSEDKKWSVSIRRCVTKDMESLPQDVRNTLLALIRDIQEYGPVRGKWPNYSKLPNNRHHCHLKKGKPTYVAIWEVVDKKGRRVEVVYADTHEKAPY